MTRHRIFTTSVASVYPHYITKAEKKGRSKSEVDEILRWLTGDSQEALEAHEHGPQLGLCGLLAAGCHAAEDGEPHGQRYAAILSRELLRDDRRQKDVRRRQVELQAAEGAARRRPRRPAPR